MTIGFLHQRDEGCQQENFRGPQRQEGPKTNIAVQRVLRSDLIFPFPLLCERSLIRPPEVLAEELLQIIKREVLVRRQVDKSLSGIDQRQFSKIGDADFRDHLHGANTSAMLLPAVPLVERENGTRMRSVGHVENDQYFFHQR